MSAFWVLDLLCVGAAVAAATMVVLLRNLSGAVMALSALGTVLAVLFVALAAPDVAQAEVVVGTIAMPALYLIALGKIRTDVPDRGNLGEDEDAGDG